MPSKHNTINYLELPMTDVAATKAFYAQVFGWTFQDWAPSYITFSGAGIDGGFTTDTPIVEGDVGPLLVIYSENLEASQAAVEAANGTITTAIFSYPGGRRFHFKDPNGSILAVWSE